MEENQEMEPKKVSRVKKISLQIQDLLRKILKIMVIILLPIVAFVVGARLFEQGHLAKKGANLRITGMCKTQSGQIRDDLAQDQIIISGMSAKHIEGILRKTREYVNCDLDKVALDTLGPISDLFKATEENIPSLTKFKETIKEEKVEDFKQYENKAFIISGVCKSSEGKNLPPFIDQKVEVANVRPLKEEPGEFVFYGIREDKVTLLCKSTDVTIKDYSQQKMDSSISMSNNVSYLGKKMLITGLCTPDFRVYKDTNRKPEVSFYDLTNTPVEVVEEEIVDGNIKALAGIVADQDAKIGSIAIYTHRIYCDTSKYPLKIKDPSDESVGVEAKK